ncbi:MAG: hypothetical protein M1553_05320, partial [Firmicutes bacterium]|nr:hypothetical protein [Bacillota bacterium]
PALAKGLTGSPEDGLDVAMDGTHTDSSCRLLYTYPQIQRLKLNFQLPGHPFSESTHYSRNPGLIRQAHDTSSISI